MRCLMGKPLGHIFWHSGKRPFRIAPHVSFDAFCWSLRERSLPGESLPAEFLLASSNL